MHWIAEAAVASQISGYPCWSAALQTYITISTTRHQFSKTWKQRYKLYMSLLYFSSCSSLDGIMRRENIIAIWDSNMCYFHDLTKQFIRTVSTWTNLSFRCFVCMWEWMVAWAGTYSSSRTSLLIIHFADFRNTVKNTKTSILDSGCRRSCN